MSVEIRLWQLVTTAHKLPVTLVVSLLLPEPLG
jgi:hypothetical protein